MLLQRIVSAAVGVGVVIGVLGAFVYLVPVQFPEPARTGWYAQCLGSGLDMSICECGESKGAALTTTEEWTAVVEGNVSPARATELLAALTAVIGECTSK